MRSVPTERRVLEVLMSKVPLDALGEGTLAILVEPFFNDWRICFNLYMLVDLVN